MTVIPEISEKAKILVEVSRQGIEMSKEKFIREVGSLCKEMGINLKTINGSAGSKKNHQEYREICIVPRENGQDGYSIWAYWIYTSMILIWNTDVWKSLKLKPAEKG